MAGNVFKEGRLSAGLTQCEAARRLGVSQPYLSQIEQGQRPVTPDLARSATVLYRLPATALPVPDSVTERDRAEPEQLARQLSSLGYPGFSHLRRQAKVNPAAVVLEALLHDDLEVRLAEALPWVLLNYPDLDWTWLVKNSKLHDLQNRIGFLVTLARKLAADQPELQAARERLTVVEHQLERSRLAREDTLCRESMPEAERRWLKKNRSPAARHWNLLTSLNLDQLSYAAAQSTARTLA